MANGVYEVMVVLDDPHRQDRFRGNYAAVSPDAALKMARIDGIVGAFIPASHESSSELEAAADADSGESNR